MAKVKKIQEEKPGDWQTIFCSLAIILVAFFVMLASYATMETGKLIEISRSFRGALNILPGGISSDKGDQVIIPSPDTSGEGTLEKVAGPIFLFLKGKGLEDQISMKSTDKAVILTLSNPVLFEQGSAKLLSQAKNLLSGLAPILKKLSLPVSIEGHTDDQPVRSGRFKSNLELSAMRAVNVLRFLHNKGNIPIDRLSAAGYGPYRPFLPNRTEDERRRNRRVEIIIPFKRDELKDVIGGSQKIPPSFRVWDLSM